MTDEGLVRGEDGRPRCRWAGTDPEYMRYHDEEWGRAVTDDRRLFEKLCLEGFQSGLSWLTILKKRPAFRRAFAGFDIEAMARFDERDVERLLGDAGIVRHRGKIEAAIHNASRALLVIEEHGALIHFFEEFVPPAAERPETVSWAALRAMPTTPSSARLAKELKRRGFKFVGPTTAYAFMQAMGLVNDHLEGCYARGEVEREQRARRG